MNDKVLYSVQLNIPVKIDGKIYVASRFSEATNSLTPPSETAFSHIQGWKYIDKLKQDNAMGLDLAKAKVLKDPDSLKGPDIEKLYYQFTENYTEPEGKVKDTVFARMEYDGYNARKTLVPDDFKDYVNPEEREGKIEFVPVEELLAAIEMEGDYKDIYLEISGRKYRINAGISIPVKNMVDFGRIKI